ncbi:hypothetical protein M0812_13789 [Anaeramoeba flamelloides]|uniref:Uncharacterized protein n=1 Tax=Anaeramoeba flamelloides TaxID=1746091 RepID=A0AAV7ZP67_9EUKA|nr:hypothetical protein M0812_13789 [Anaeramoeba flamelloides]
MISPELYEICKALISLKSTILEKQQSAVLTNDKKRRTHQGCTLKVGNTKSSIVLQTRTLRRQQKATTEHTRPNTDVFASKESLSRTQHTKAGRMKFSELEAFIKRKPKPSWKKRLCKFYQYDPELLVGWKQLSESEHNTQKPSTIIIQKKLFDLYSQILNTDDDHTFSVRIYKSSQRAVQEYLKKLGYFRSSKYSRKILEFRLVK